MKNKLFFTLIFVAFSAFSDDWVYQNAKDVIISFGLLPPTIENPFPDLRGSLVQMQASHNLITKWQKLYQTLDNRLTFPTKAQKEQIREGYRMAKKKVNTNNVCPLPKKFELFWLTQLGVSREENNSAEFYEETFLKWSENPNLIPIKPEFSFVYDEKGQVLELIVEKK